ncbi:hypothetical protein [Sulfurimonas sp.]
MYEFADKLTILQNSIIPKFLNLFDDENKRNKVQNYFSTLVPKKIIDINNEEHAYIKDFSKEKIIKNSIQYSSFDIDEENLNYLSGMYPPN